MNLAGAKKILNAAVKKSEEIKAKMIIAIVDNGANLVGLYKFVLFFQTQPKPQLKLD